MKKTLSFAFTIFSLKFCFSQLVAPHSIATNQLVSADYLESPEKWQKESFHNYDQSREDVTRRDRNAKHFKNEDGTYTAIIASGDLHYWEENHWNTIFHTIEATSNGFQNITNAHKTYFPAVAQNPLRTILASGEELKEMMNMKMYFEGNGQVLNVHQINGSTGTAEYNELTYANVYGNGIDLRLIQHTTKRKMDYVVQSLDALGSIPGQASFLVFEEKVEIPSGCLAFLEGNQIILRKSDGQILAIYEKPIFKDAPKADEHGHMHSNEVEGSYEITQLGTILTVKTKVQLSWLTSFDRNFPVVIDPTLNCNPNNTANWTGYHRTTSGNSDYFDGSANFTSTNITNSVNDYLILGRYDYDNVYNSWMKFNISSVPDGACVTASAINYGIAYNYSNDPPNCIVNVRLRHMATDPSNAFNAGNNTARLADIRDGDIFQTQNLAAGPTGTGLRTVSLGAFLNHLTSQLPSDWFAIGLNSYSGGPHTSCYVEIYGHSNANKPYLTVNYRELTVNAGADQSICLGQQITLTGSVSPAMPSNTTLFSENFESYGNVSPLPTTGATWKSSVITGSSWEWQIKNSCAPAGGSRCLNMRDGSAVDCDYTWDNNGNKVAWYGTLIDASLHSGLLMNFKWKAYGEPTFDYGKVVYSLDGSNWMDLNTTEYSGQSSWQTVTNLDLSTLNGQQFYIGFRWQNDNNTGTAPGFIIDDISITGTPLSLTYAWSGGPIVSGGTTLTPVVNPTTSTNYTLTATSGSCSFTDVVAVNLPTMSTVLSNNNESATCLVSGNSWIHFYHSSGRYIGAIHPQGQNLGNVSMTSYVDPTNALVPACNYPTTTSLMTSVLQRHWVMIPASQPLAAVQVGLPFLNAELNSLITASNANTNSNDNVSAIGGLLLSKYHGPANVDNLASNNCPANGGNGNTTIHAQTSNGNLAGVFPGFVNTSYTTHSIPNFSEFWLHGASNNSPLPVTLSSFAASCEADGNQVNVQWTTASEQNSMRFDVERSTDGIEWEVIGSRTAAGNSSTSLYYSLFDYDVRAFPTIYYRLNQIDLNGEEVRHEPTSTACQSNERGFELFPNPAGSEVAILLLGEFSEEVAFSFTDLNGKEVIKIKSNPQNGKMMTVDLQNLLPGVYLVKLLGADSPNVVRLIRQ